jgi:hypothetical protein
MVPGQKFPRILVQYAISSSNPLSTALIKQRPSLTVYNMKLIATLPLLILLTPLTQAWGEIGHRTIGYLAFRYLDPAGLALFNTLIQPDATFDISDGAVWADNQKFKWPWSKPWHYIDAKDNPPSACSITYSSDWPKDKGCIIGAIKNFTARVNDPDLNAVQQGEALKFLLHFVGDVHQPLHTEDTCTGGNGIVVKWGNNEEKLHAVWDANIINKLLKYKKPKGDTNNVYDKFLSNGWANTLFEDSESVDMAAECTDVTTPEKCSLDWAGGANKLICSYVLKGFTKSQGTEDCPIWKGPSDASKEYYDGAVPLVEEQIKLAGARLGAWVNGLAAERVAMEKVRLDSGGYLKTQGENLEL